MIRPVIIASPLKSLPFSISYTLNMWQYSKNLGRLSVNVTTALKKTGNLYNKKSRLSKGRPAYNCTTSGCFP